MRPWFERSLRQEFLWAEQQRWLGTPFFPHAESIGHGVDCVRLVHALYVAIDAIPRLDLPSYALDHAKHSTRTQLLQFLLSHPALAGRLLMVPPSGKRMAGDLIGLQSGRVDHHLAIVTPYDEAVHAVEDHGVIRTPLNDRKFIARTLYVLRLHEIA